MDRGFAVKEYRKRVAKGNEPVVNWYDVAGDSTIFDPIFLHINQLLDYVDVGCDRGIQYSVWKSL